MNIPTSYKFTILIVFFLSIVILTSRKKESRNYLLSDQIENIQCTYSCHASFYLYDYSRKQGFSEKGENSLHRSASLTKLLTVYCSMKNLPDSVPCFEYIQSKNKLMVAPMGDPSFLSSWNTSKRVYNFLKSSKYPIVITNEKLDCPILGKGWSWDDYDKTYATCRSTMPIYENCVNFAVNNKTKIEVSPLYFRDSISFQYHPSKRTFSRMINNNNFICNTYAIPQKEYTKRIPFISSNELSTRLLQDTLNKCVKLCNKQAQLKNGKHLYNCSSEALHTEILTNSNSFAAEQLLLLCSKVALGYFNPDAIIQDICTTQFSDKLQSFKWVDGSGLSIHNFMTPKFTTELILKIIELKGIDYLQNILPTGNQGTLSGFYKSLEGKLYAKTGTHSNTFNITGILYPSKDKPIIFAIMVDNFICEPYLIKKEVEKIITHLYNTL